MFFKFTIINIDNYKIKELKHSKEPKERKIQQMDMETLLKIKQRQDLLKQYKINLENLKKEDKKIS